MKTIFAVTLLLFAIYVPECMPCHQSGCSPGFCCWLTYPPTTATDPYSCVSNSTLGVSCGPCGCLQGYNCTSNGGCQLLRRVG
uniref:U17-hexatoxin-Hi1a n=1 Tax=Hadronyche infensa TaxID=153481 RepID=TH1A_HADIN